MHLATALRCGGGCWNDAPGDFSQGFGPEPYRVAYIQPSRRPVDGRYGENPNRLEKHHQLQVILKPPPADIQMVYLESLTAMGIRLDEHDIKFEEDNWEWPMGGATGVGWQVMLDGQEITQFTYFQQIGGLELMPISGEITYGLERIAMYLNDVENVFDVPWNDHISYGEVRHRDEFEFSKYYFEIADIERYFRLFDEFEAEVQRLMAADLVLPAYENCLKCSHIFNILDARGARQCNRTRPHHRACPEVAQSSGAILPGKPRKGRVPVAGWES